MGRSRKFLEIVEKYEVILPDTCVLISSYEDCNGEKSLEDKIEYARGNMKSLSYWNSNFKKYGGENLFLVEDLLKELFSHRNGKVKFLKNSFNKESFNSGENEKYVLLKDYEKLVNSSYKRSKNLKKSIRNQEAIFDLKKRNSNLFNLVYAKYVHLKDQERALTEEDYSLLVSGIMASSLKKTAIISNDSGIKDAWKELVLRENSFKKNLAFYIRENFDGYKKIFVKNKKIKK